MSFLPALFTAILHVLFMGWTILHPVVNQSPPPANSTSSESDLGYQQRPSGYMVYASTRVIDSGYWHTSGNLILDRQGRSIRIQGINWYGFETTRKVPGGLAVQDYRAILETIRSEGFNTVRIPFSNEMIRNPVIPQAISFASDRGQAINQPLRGLNSLQILDRIVEHAGKIGLKIILDNHRSEAGNSAEDNGLWYTADFPESAWIADWQMLARRYSGNSTVIGMDLRNEPHNATSGGSCWAGCGPAHDWHLAAQRAGDAVLAINPHLIVFVEGTDVVNGDWYWWGGNLQGVLFAPVRLRVPNQLVYSAHEYGPQEYAQKWFKGATSSSLMAVFDRHWDFISRNKIAPVWIGEFGTSNRTQDITDTTPGTEGQWFQALVSYLDLNSEVGWTLWALNGEDPDGLLDPDYATPANTLKMTTLSRIMNSQTRPTALPLQRPAGSQLIGSHQAPAPNLPRHSTRATGAVPAYRPHLPTSVLHGQYNDGSARPPLHSQVFAEADGN